MIARPLAAADLLWAWENGAYRHPVDRALLMLSAACPERTASDLASLTIGQRDGLLFQARTQTLGDRLDSRAQCPACATELQFSLAVSDLLDSSQPYDERTQFEIDIRGYSLRLKCPDSRDLAAAARAGSPEAAQCLLLARCVLDATRAGRPVAADDLPAHVKEAVAEQIAERDPQADIQIDLVCPDCGHRWPLAFDIGAYFWGEITHRAPQVLHEVHTLARAYGWAESEILAMSPARRGAYLALAG